MFDVKLGLKSFLRNIYVFIHYGKLLGQFILRLTLCFIVLPHALIAMEFRYRHDLILQYDDALIFVII